MMLNEENLREAAAWLAARDTDLAVVFETFGPPPLWARPPGFATLVYIILEQQVSLASARAAYRRLGEAIGTITPQGFLTLDDVALKQIGFSRQKTRYGRILAQAILDGTVDLDGLAVLADDEVRAVLTGITGIGRWTADIYLMEALLRPDVWPAGDLALAIAVQRVKRLHSVPKSPMLQELGAIYTPWRSVAARMFWWHYLGGLMPGG
jgi:DNA-3-methyladenine glycosylase II